MSVVSAYMPFIPNQVSISNIARDVKHPTTNENKHIIKEACDNQASYFPSHTLQFEYAWRDLLRSGT